MVNEFYEKKSADTNTYTGTGIITKDQQLANELNKSMTKKFEKCKKIFYLWC